MFPQLAIDGRINYGKPENLWTFFRFFRRLRRRFSLIKACISLLMKSTDVLVPPQTPSDEMPGLADMATIVQQGTELNSRLIEFIRLTS